MSEKWRPDSAAGVEVTLHNERKLDPKETATFQENLGGFIEGLRNSIRELEQSGADPDLLVELQEQLAGFEDSFEAIEDGGPVIVHDSEK